MADITTSAGSGTSINDLAPELISQILNHFDPRTTHNIYCDVPRQDNPSTRALGACRLTCKYLDAIAKPFLFHFICINGTTSLDRVTRLLDILKKDATIEPEIHTFWLYGVPSRTQTAQQVQYMTRTLWNHNLDLTKLFDCLHHLKVFVFEVISHPYTAVLPLEWDTMGEEMRDSITKMLSRSSIRSLKFNNLSGLPMDLFAGCPNLEHLDVASINGRSHHLDMAYDPTANVKPITPQLHHVDGWKLKLKSLKADKACEALLRFQPTVAERLSWNGCESTDLNPILNRSRRSLKDLTIHIPRGDDASLNIFQGLHIHVFNSLTTLRVHRHRDLTIAFISTLTWFINTQFQIRSPTITYFQLCVVGRWSGFTGLYSRIHLKPRPKEWKDLETALRVSFPHLQKLVFELIDPIERQGVERLKVSVKWVLPLMTEMESVRVLLRFRCKTSEDRREEVDMVGVTIPHVSSPFV